MNALVWAIDCMQNLHQNYVIFATDFSQLVKIVSKPEECTVFAIYLEDIKILKNSFLSSQIIHETQNKKIDSLARSVRKHLSFVRYGTADLDVKVSISLSMLMIKK